MTKSHNRIQKIPVMLNISVVDLAAAYRACAQAWLTNILTIKRWTLDPLQKWHHFVITTITLASINLICQKYVVGNLISQCIIMSVKFKENYRAWRERFVILSTSMFPNLPVFDTPNNLAEKCLKFKTR